MTFFRSMKSEFYRAPRNSKYDWIPVGFGVLLIVLSSVGILVDDAQGALFSVDSEFFLLGLAFLMMGGAELLEIDQIRLSALLRIITIVAFTSFLVAIILTF